MYTIQRCFIPGDEWIYFKIYTGNMSSDKVLLLYVLRIVKELKKHCLIKKWFFIRYEDPNFHLRVRVLASESKSIEEIIYIFNKYLVKAVRREVVWKVQIDTYERELERYGNSLINEAETIFFIDSECLISIIRILQDKDESYRWMIAIKLIDQFLSDFDFDIKSKQILLQKLSSSFKHEFGFNKFNSKQFNTKYRENKKTIELILCKDSSDLVLYDFAKIIKGRSIKMKSTIYFILNKINYIQRELFVSSYIHMSLNRLFKDRNRIHELVLYDLLYRFYSDEIARMNYR